MSIQEVHVVRKLTSVSLTAFLTLSAVICLVLAAGAEIAGPP